METIYKTLRMQMENIILIGMPGCGKSTVGKLLAEATGKQFEDADAYIEKSAGMSIPEIFQKEGESGFRIRETQALRELGQRSGLVIATGGGCVTRPENYPLLHQNGRICYLKRDISALPTDGRPLSKAGHLAQMFAVRKPLYERFADWCVTNDGPPAETVSAIL